MGSLRLLLAALAVTLCLPAAAHAAALGVNKPNGPAPVSGYPDGLRDLGAKYSRHFVFWESLQPAGPGPMDPAVLQAFRDRAAEDVAAGAVPVFVVTNSPQWASGVANPKAPPADPATYATFVQAFAREMRAVIGDSPIAYEIWNEADEKDFWFNAADPSAGAPPARYAALLDAAYAAIKAPEGDPAAAVVFGPTTGNNYPFVAAVVDAGARSFDAVAVHTDTACQTHGPDFYVRNRGDGGDGRINRFSFLGYREVREVLLARGLDRPIWITELGWSATATACARIPGQEGRAAGVSEGQQAEFLARAMSCIANDPYVAVAIWFNYSDPIGSADSELHRYGLLRPDFSRRPAYATFQQAARGAFGAGPCGDFTPPGVVVHSPQPGQQVVDTAALKLEASSPDADLARITYAIKGAPSEIRNFTNGGAPFAPGQRLGLDWQGVRGLPLGRQTLVVTALDVIGNQSQVEVPFSRVPVTALPDLETRFDRVKLRRVKRRTTTYSGRLRSADPGRSLKGMLTAKDKVRCTWQIRRPAPRGKGRRARTVWKTIHRQTRSASTAKVTQRAFSCHQKVRYAGRWRVRAQFAGKGPVKPARTPWKRFTAKG